MLCWSGYEDHKNGYQTRKSTNIRNICVSIQLIRICELIADAENYVKRFIIAWYKSCIFSWSVMFHSIIYINHFFPTHPGPFHQGLFGTLCLSFSRSASIAFTISSKKKTSQKCWQGPIVLTSSGNVLLTSIEYNVQIRLLIESGAVKITLGVPKWKIVWLTQF